MAHAAPAPHDASNDVFSPRAHRIAAWAVPVVLGLVYGYWVAAIRRSGGPITGWNLLLGFVSALALAAAYVAVRALAPRMKRESHALLWTAFAGCAFGFVYSQTGATIWRSVMMSLGVAAGVFVVQFYRYYTREDGEGHRIR
ncbi:hypothetical protein ACVNF4_01625 [Streptomyces sp. S6]